MFEPLTLRNDPAAQQEQPDITTRSFSVRADSINEADRSVEAIVATEDPVTVYDWYRGEVIDEVLRMDGAVLPAQVPMLENHFRWSLDSVLGSTRGFRVSGSELFARLYFAEGDDTAERAWKKVKQKHLDAVSAGYRSIEFTDIPAGQTQTVGGRSYTAKQRTLRVTTRWEPREVSLVPIGADKRARIRGDVPPPGTRKESAAMNPKLKAFLVTLGLRSDASDVEAQAFFNKLSQADQARAEAAAAEQTPPGGNGTVGGNPPVTGQRNEPPTNPPPPVTPPTNPPTEGQRQDPVMVERERIRSINELAGDDVPRELVTRALNEGWDTGRAAREFVGAIRSARGPAGQGVQGPAIHSRSHEGSCNALSLGMGLMMRSGITEPLQRYHRVVDGAMMPVRNAEQNADLMRAADNAYQYRDMSLVDICREACRMDQGRIPTNRNEAIRTALSGSTLTAIFTTNVSAQLMQGYSDATDTTVGWCSEADVPNFQSNERAQMGKVGGLTKHKRGGKADHLDNSDSKEEYKIARYSGQFVVDEMDCIDDRFGAVEQVSPVDMGLSARQLRPNMVYAILLANAALQADNKPLFHADHGNLGTGAFNAENVQALITLFMKQRKRKRPLTLSPRYLLVPADLFFTADILLTSAQRVQATAGDKNPLKTLGITLVPDDRLGAAGVDDPVSGTHYAGSALHYFLTARPGENGAKTIEVGYLRGTGRAPMMRSFTLQQGQWGIGWDINMDIGAKALDYPGMAKSTGA